MHAGDLTSERRSATRHRVRLSVEMDTGVGVTRDFSSTGLYLLTDRPLAIGQIVQLRVQVPDRDRSASFRLGGSGRVVRVESVEGAVGAGIALVLGGVSLMQASP